MRLTVRQTFVAVLFIGLFVMSIRPIADPDFWWHLRTGQLIAETRSIPAADPFSHTNLGKPWIAHEWLSEWLIFVLYRVGNYGLLIFVFSVLIACSSLFAYLRCPPGSRPYLAGFATLLGALASAPAWGVRPQIFSLLFFSLFLFLLDRYQQVRQARFLLPLPILMLLWVNLHAAYFLGFVVIGIYLGGDVFAWIAAAVRRQRLHPGNLMAFGGVLLGCILAALFNPNGYHILLYPFETLTSPSMQQFIQEWASPDFHQTEWQPLAWLLLALIAAGLMGRHPVSPARLLLTVIFAYAALRSMRHVPLFAITAVPVLAEQFAGLITRGAGERRGDDSGVRDGRRSVGRLNAILVTAIVLAAALRFTAVLQEQSQTEQDGFPAAAVDWIVQNEPPGNIYNTYGWGGYLIWRLYPQYLVYIDGRADVYGDDFIYCYTSIYYGRPGWEQALSAHDVRLVLVEPASGLALVLRQVSGWGIAYEDEGSVVFILPAVDESE